MWRGQLVSVTPLTYACSSCVRSCVLLLSQPASAFSLKQSGPNATTNMPPGRNTRLACSAQHKHSRSSSSSSTVAVGVLGSLLLRMWCRTVTTVLTATLSHSLLSQPHMRQQEGDAHLSHHGLHLCEVLHAIDAQHHIIACIQLLQQQGL